MEITIRRATVADADALAGLRYDFRAEMEPAPEPRETFVARCAAWMRERLRDASPWSAWLALDDSAPVGCLWLQLVEKIPNPAPELEHHGYITSVYVAPRARNRGVGARLMEAALAHGRQHAVDSIVLWPSERSRSLYARYGFEEPSDIMELVLDGQRTLGRR